MSIIEKNVHESGLYPWGEGSTYKNSTVFIDRVSQLREEGKTEKEMLEIINESLPEEYRMTLPEFRMARNLAHSDRLNERDEILYKMVKDGKTWDDIGEAMGVSPADAEMHYNINMANFGGIPSKRMATRALVNVLFDEVMQKKMVIVNDGAKKFHASQPLFDHVVKILRTGCGVRRYFVKIKKSSDVLVVLGGMRGQKWVEEHLSEAKELDSHRLA